MHPGRVEELPPLRETKSAGELTNPHGCAGAVGMSSGSWGRRVSGRAVGSARHEMGVVDYECAGRRSPLRADLHTGVVALIGS